VRRLARTIHKLSAAAAGSSVRTALRSVDLLGVLQECACGGLGRDVLSRPALPPLRDDARFTKLLLRMNLEP